MFERIRRWLRWKWWELLMVVLAILTVHWLATGALAKYAAMTVTDNGTVVSEQKPWAEMQDYWNGGRYLRYPADLLCRVEVSGDARAEIRLPLLPPWKVDVMSFPVTDPDAELGVALQGVAGHPADFERDGRTLVITPDFSTGDHQFILVRAFWYNLGGRQEMHYIFMLSRPASDS